MTDTIWLQRPQADVPWGFRLQGGRDTGNPLTVHRVTAGSIAATGLVVGDVILQIGHTPTQSLTQHEAQELIKNCGNLMQIIIKGGGRGGSVGQQFQGMKLEDKPTHSLPSQRVSRAPPGAPDHNYTPPPVPDAVLNMASRQGTEDKKPWAYAPDMASIQEQRNKVRKRQPVAAIPHYQNILNMPSFDDKPVKVQNVTKPSAKSDEAHSNGDEYTCVMAEKYNNPLGLYTEDNVREALTGQTQGRFTDVRRLPNKDEKDITQSAVYKMIHGLDEPRNKTRNYPKEGYGQVCEPSGDDEVHFSGMIPSSEIPSRSFHMLQDMTSQSEIDQTSIRPNFGEEAGEVSQYDEQSIRYRGCNIPSKSFRMLQSMTGGPKDTPIAVAKERRMMRRQRSQDVDSGGPGAPQGMTLDGSASHTVLNDSTNQAPGTPPIQVDVVPVSKPTVLTLRHKPTLSPKPAQVADTEDYGGFNENAYLAGNIAILSGERHARKLSTENVCEADVEEERGEEESKDFDEDAYLSGKLNIFGRSQPVSMTRKEKEESSTPISWMQKTQRVDCSEFTEEEFLKGQYPMVQVNSTENLLQPMPVSMFSLKPSSRGEETAKPDNKEVEREFSEEDYLAGRISILGAGDRSVGAPRGKKQDVEEMPSWKKSDDVMDDEFDEDAFLRGRMSGPMLHRSASESMMHQNTGEQRAIWEMGPGEQEEEMSLSDAEFDETAYLSGRPNFRRTSLHNDMSRDLPNIPTKAFSLLRRSQSHECSPYTSTGKLAQDEDTENQSSPDPNQAYNEMVYIGNKIPSRTFSRLQKCMERTQNTVATDPLDRLRHQRGIDAEDAVDIIKIDKHNPEEYFSKLKETVEQENCIKIEPEDEVTEF